MEEKNVKKFIGKNADKIYENMEKSGNFSICSFFFSYIYYMYRKMYLVGAIIFLIEYLLLSYVKIQNQVLVVLINIGLGFLFYPLYKKHIERKMNKINIKMGENLENEEMLERMYKKKGGTSILSAILIPMIMFIILVGSMAKLIYDEALDISQGVIQNNIEYEKEYEDIQSEIESEFQEKTLTTNGITVNFNDNWEVSDISGNNGLKNIHNEIILLPTAVVEFEQNELGKDTKENRDRMYKAFMEEQRKAQSDINNEIINESGELKEISKGRYSIEYDTYTSVGEGVYGKGYIIIDMNQNKMAIYAIGSSQHFDREDIQEINKIVYSSKF